MHEQVSEVFRRIYVGKKTGVLIGEAATHKRAVFFLSGAVVAARSTHAKDRLGELLMEHGRISQQQFDEASRSIKSGRKMGDILTSMGLLEKTEIERFVKMQLTDIVCSLLIEPPRRLAFSALSEVESVVSKPLPVGSLLMEAARRAPRIEKSMRKLLEDDERLMPSPHPGLQSQELSLALEEKFVLSRIDGKLSTRALLPLSPLSEEATLRTLLGLVHAGVIVTQEEASRQQEGLPEEATVETGGADGAPSDASVSRGSVSDERMRDEIERLFERAQSRDHWHALGIVQGASPKGIKEAFHARVRRFHPDRLGHIGDEGLREKASHILQRAQEAFDALSTGAAASNEIAQGNEPRNESTGTGSGHDSGAPPLAAAPAVREAQEVFIRAKRAYESEDYWEAVQLCRQAIERNGTRAEYYYLLGRALSQNPKWRTDAEQNFKIASQLDPWKPEYFGALGELYLKAGMRLRARNMFEQAKGIDPGFVVPDLK